MKIPTTLFLLFLFFVLGLPNFARTQQLIACLSSGEVTNFTTDHSGSGRRLFLLSIQNLRFTKPHINKPIAVIFPENVEQVATAIRCARQGSWTIRLRSGGHSFEGLSSHADTPFVIVDMMNMNRISIDLESETAWVEGGATIGEVYYAIATSSKNYGFPAGMCSTVGIGGHISGGGYGALVRKYGLASDNVVDAILIDAEGRALDRKAMGEDAFWAIRGGGGGNFGVVVNWKVRLVRVPERVTALRIMSSGNTSEMAKLWHKWQLVASTLEDDFFLQALVLAARNQPETTIWMLFMGLYLGPKNSALASINSAFPELKASSNHCEEMFWAEAMISLRGDPQVQTVEDLKNRLSFRKTFSKAKSDFIEVPISLSALEGALELVAKQQQLAILLDPYGGVMRMIESDASPFPFRAGTLYGIEYFVDWSEEEDGNSQEYIEWMRRLYEYMAHFAMKTPRGAYVNNVDLDLGVTNRPSQRRECSDNLAQVTLTWGEKNTTGNYSDAVEEAREWGEKYFMGNYDRLVRAKTLIDPSDVFRHPQSIPPLNLIY
ncbi:reticuline oxidase-like [Aristolochia californica]|uniref:reticuline oxidase-like n=1 Tax=Aristolochia californica TaxID=171875 RepID=UPI0035D57D22